MQKLKNLVSYNLKDKCLLKTCKDLSSKINKVTCVIIMSIQGVQDISLYKRIENATIQPQNFMCY